MIFFKNIKFPQKMKPILSYDIFPIIINFLRNDRNTLFSCVLVSRTMSMLVIPLLWKDPFMCDDSYNTINQYQSALLIRTYLACLTEEERKYLKNKGVNIRDFPKPIFNYAGFLEEISHYNSLYHSILYWILLEYKDYKEENLNNIKDIHQIDENEIIQYPLINSLYHMLFKKSKFKSLEISIDTLRIADPIDQQFFVNLNISNLTNLVIYLKDELKENQKSFDFLLNMIKKWCFNIKHIKISNSLVFDDQRLPKTPLEIINQQTNLQKLDLKTHEPNIIINEILSNLKGQNFNFLTEMELHHTDLSENSRLKGLSSINSLKSLFLSSCKGISIYNIFILSDSLIKLNKLKFISNEFSLGLIISTIGKSLKELITNQLDDDSSEFISYYCSESLINLDVGIDLEVKRIFYDLIKKLKIIHLKINFYNKSTGQILNDLGFYLPNSLKYLSLFGLFTFKNSFNVENLENLLLNCNVAIESLEIYGTINSDLLTVILNYIEKNRNFKSLITIDNLNHKVRKKSELSLLKDC